MLGKPGKGKLCWASQVRGKSCQVRGKSCQASQGRGKSCWTSHGRGKSCCASHGRHKSCQASQGRVSHAGQARERVSHAGQAREGVSHATVFWGSSGVCSWVASPYLLTVLTLTLTSFWRAKRLHCALVTAGFTLSFTFYLDPLAP